MSVDLEEQYDKVYRYCYMKLKHRQMAEDITQETFLRFLESSAYKELGKQLPYLYTIARNKCTDYYRKKNFLPLDAEIPVPGGEEEVVLSAAVEQMVRQLDREDQELVFLRYVNELTVNEISKILGISRYSVYRRTTHCLNELKKLMKRRELFE